MVRRQKASTMERRRVWMELALRAHIRDRCISPLHFWGAGVMMMLAKGIGNPKQTVSSQDK